MPRPKLNLILVSKPIAMAFTSLMLAAAPATAAPFTDLQPRFLGDLIELVKDVFGVVEDIADSISSNTNEGEKDPVQLPAHAGLSIEAWCIENEHDVLKKWFKKEFQDHCYMVEHEAFTHVDPLYEGMNAVIWDEVSPIGDVGDKVRFEMAW